MSQPRADELPTVLTPRRANPQCVAAFLTDAAHRGTLETAVRHLANIGAVVVTGYSGGMDALGDDATLEMMTCGRYAIAWDRTTAAYAAHLLIGRG